jgi:NTE family protein
MAKDTSLVLSGGIGLGAYQAGAYERLHAARDFNIGCIAGSSIGAVNALLIAGGDRDLAVERLRAFWSEGPFWQSSPPLALDWHLNSWISALQSRVFGADNLFRPRMWLGELRRFQSVYDLSPMQSKLQRLVDFDRLNAGPIHVRIATTDVETGELVIFDSAVAPISIQHVLASCGYLPEFAPVEIGGRLLGDGGLYANAPFEAAMAGAGEPPKPFTFVVDLFSRDGRRPSGFQQALARKNDLLFGNQTYRALEAYASSGRLGAVVYLSYRAPEFEADSEKPFDLSAESINARWIEGYRDMNCALGRTDSIRPGTVTPIRRSMHLK